MTIVRRVLGILGIVGFFMGFLGALLSRTTNAKIEGLATQIAGLALFFIMVSVE